MFNVEPLSECKDPVYRRLYISSIKSSYGRDAMNRVSTKSPKKNRKIRDTCFICPTCEPKNHVSHFPFHMSRKITAAARVPSYGMIISGFWHDFYQKSRQNPRPFGMIHLPGVITPATNTTSLRDLTEYDNSIWLPTLRPYVTS